jgi:hypothetical protein
VCLDPHGRVKAEPVDVGAQGLPRRVLARHRAAQGQHLLPGAWTEGDAVGTCRGLQRPEHAGLVGIAVDVGHVRRTSSSTNTPRRVSSFIGQKLHGAARILVCW